MLVLAVATRCGSRDVTCLYRTADAPLQLSGFRLFSIYNRATITRGSVPGLDLAAYCSAFRPEGMFDYYPLLFPVLAPPTMIFMDQTSSAKLAPLTSQGQSGGIEATPHSGSLSQEHFVCESVDKWGRSSLGLISSETFTR